MTAKSHEFVPPGQENVPEPIARTDARLAATQQIATLLDTPPPADGKPHDPAAARTTAGALFKLASGFDPDQLTAAEQSSVKASGDDTALIRKAPGGSTILTDAGRQRLTQAAPAAAPFVTGNRNAGPAATVTTAVAATATADHERGKCQDRATAAEPRP